MPRATWTVSARDFRVLRNLRWSPDGVSLLVGPNGSGKTTALDVLDFLRNFYRHGSAEAVRLAKGAAHLRHRRAEPRAAVHLELAVGDLTWVLDLPIEGGGVSANHGELLKRGDEVLLRRAMFATDVYFGSERRETGEDSNLKAFSLVRPDAQIDPLLDFLAGVRIYRSYDLNQVSQPQSSSLPSDSLLPSGKNLWNVLRAWQASPRRYRDQFAWVLRSLREAFPDLIKDLETEALGHTVFARFYPPDSDSGEDYLSMDLAADGLLVGILHLTAVAGAREGSVLAFDEMENQLHPHAIRSILASMREIAEERDLTIILTTHSPVLMNEFKGHEHQLYVLERGHDALPVALDEAKDPDWLAHFSLGDLYDREDFGAPTRESSP